MLVGYPCSGKDTVGAYIYKKYDYVPLSFASVLIYACKLVRSENPMDGIDFSQFVMSRLGLSMEQSFDMYNEYKDISIEGKRDRLLLQKLGTDFRKIKNDVWVSDVREIISKDAYDHKFVITDTRRQYELDSFPKAVSVYIDVKDDTCYKRLKERDGYYDVDILSREAEVEIPTLKDKCDFVINNDGSLDELYKQVDEIMEVINNEQKEQN